jgi:hypothetical protein
MASPTFYPSTLTDEILAEESAAVLAAKMQKSFDKIVADMAAPTAKAAPQSVKAAKRHITVRVTMPHVKKYGKQPVMTLTYACTFVVTVGEKVLCPPTRLNPKWTTGVVTDLEANGYRGPVKYVAPLGGRGTKKAGESK